MNLNCQPGFVTIGYEGVMEDQGKNSESTHGSSGAKSSLEECPPIADVEKEDQPPESPADTQIERVNDVDRPAGSRVASVEELTLTSTESEEHDLLADPEDFVHSTAWAPHPAADQQSINELHAYFSQFYSIRRVVKQTYFEFKRACQEIQELLTSASIGETGSDRGSGGTEAWFSPSEEQTVMNALQTDPILMVLGCKGSGKSSVINGILGDDILPSSSAMLKYACNGIVHLKYDDTGYVKITRTSTERKLSSGQTWEDSTGLENPAQAATQQRPSQQVRDFIEEIMSDQERSAWASLDNCTLEIGVPNPILRTRVQFLEIPGDCFDPRLRERLLRQLMWCNHQTVMYIIDGNKGLGNSDREFLFFLKANIPSLRIFFIINKVDYDPEAEEMDCESEGDDEAGGTGADVERYHSSGAQTQKRKQKLAIDQLNKYKLAGDKQLVFPVSMLRQKCRLDGATEQIKALNVEYEASYRSMVAALKNCLVETGRSRMELALSTLFLVAVRTFDAFTRDPGAEADEGARQAEQASKERIQQSFRQAKEKFKECKANLLVDLEKIHKRCEGSIVDACQRLEFGPLRLYTRIRNNEVEQQYREQINNYVLHLLNIEINESRELRTNEVKTVLFEEVEKLKQIFSNTSQETHPSSPWDDFIRTHADELIMGIVKLNFSVEWKGEAGFIKWIKKLWSDATVSKTKVSGPNTPEWKSEVAREFYASINLDAVVRKMFAGVDWTLKQAESALLNLANSRHKFAAKLQKLLAKDNQVALHVWQRVQFCLVSAEALKNLQAHGTLSSSSLTETVTNTCLGRLCHLTRGYASFCATNESGVAATVTKIGTAGAQEPSDFSNWGSLLGGIPNHHLMKGKALLNKRCVAVTLMVTYTDKYELCVIHTAYRGSLKDSIEEQQPAERYNKVQGFEMIRDLLQIWRQFSQEKAAPPWSLKLCRLKSSRIEGASVVYDLLERPLPTLKKDSALGGLFARPEAGARQEKQLSELSNFLEITFMILVRQTKEFSQEELSRIDERERVDERHRELKKYLTTLTSGCQHLRELDPIPVDNIANFWYTGNDRKVKDIENWIDKSRGRALHQK